MKDIEEILMSYCNNEMDKLKKMCDPMIIKIGGISNKDYDDFYSIALDVLADTAKRYNPAHQCGFDSFLASNIKRRFKTEIRDRNRKKCIPASQLQSIYSLISEDGVELSELIPSDFDTFEEAFGEDLSGTKIERYLQRLSIRQREIVSLLSQGYNADEIREYLHMSKNEYSNEIAIIQAYENVRILF